MVESVARSDNSHFFSSTRCWFYPYFWEAVWGVVGLSPNPAEGIDLELRKKMFGIRSLKKLLFPLTSRTQIHKN